MVTHFLIHFRKQVITAKRDRLIRVRFQGGGTDGGRSGRDVYLPPRQGALRPSVPPPSSLPPLQRAYLVAVESNEDEKLWSVEDSLNELATLARTAGAEVVGTMVQRLHRPDVATYLGKGRLQELAELEKQAGFDLVIFNDELSPSQQRNLEKILHARVLDRTALILDIFAQHAHTREGRLQVELAQLEYRLPRLTGRGTELSRLGGGTRSAGAGGVGGAIGVRGPGETKFEIDRRLIRCIIEELR